MEKNKFVKYLEFTIERGHIESIEQPISLEELNNTWIRLYQKEKENGFEKENDADLINTLIDQLIESIRANKYEIVIPEELCRIYRDLYL